MKCTKLSRDATPLMRLAKHRHKMQAKAEARAVQEPTGFGLPTRENKRNREVLDAE